MNSDGSTHVELHRSLSKVLAILTTSAIFALGSLTLFLLKSAGNEHVQEISFVLLLCAVFFGFSAVIIWRMYLPLLSRTTVIAQARPEGLVVPFLGSNKPIPWEKIRPASFEFYFGRMLCMQVYLSVDPREYPVAAGFGKANVAARIKRLEKSGFYIAIIPTGLWGGHSKLRNLIASHKTGR